MTAGPHRSSVRGAVRRPEDLGEEPRLRLREVFRERGVGDVELVGDPGGVGPVAVVEVAQPVGRPDDLRLPVGQRAAVDDHRVPPVVGVGVRPDQVPDRHPLGDVVERRHDPAEPVDVGETQREHEGAVGRVDVGDGAVQPLDDLAGAGGVGVARELVDPIAADLHHRVGVEVVGGDVGVDAELLGHRAVGGPGPGHVPDRRRRPLVGGVGRRERRHRTGGRHVHGQLHADALCHRVDFVAGP